MFDHLTTFLVDKIKGIVPFLEFDKMIDAPLMSKRIYLLNRDVHLPFTIVAAALLNWKFIITVLPYLFAHFTFILTLKPNFTKCILRTAQRGG